MPAVSAKALLGTAVGALAPDLAAGPLAPLVERGAAPARSSGG